MINSKSKYICVLIIVSLVTVFSSVPASAHKVKVFADVQGDTVSGYGYYPGGNRIKGAAVKLIDPYQNVISKTVTNENGEFTFKVTFRTDYRIVLDIGEGHGASFMIEQSEFSTELPEQNITQETESKAQVQVNETETKKNYELDRKVISEIVEQSVARQIRPLREDLAMAEDKRNLNDIIGGIGYIVGLAGLAVLILNRRKN